MDLSFIIPVYNEAPTLKELAKGIAAHAGTEDLEIVFVDDGSTDDSVRVIQEIASADSRVHLRQLDGHQGKTAALAEGFQHARGAIVFTMDSDGQDDPQEIPAFLKKLEEEFDLVCGWKRTRKDAGFRVAASWVFNRIVRIVFGVALRDVNCGFKAMRLEVARALRLERDYHRFIPVLASRAGYRVGELPVVHHPRLHGRSKYGPRRYINALRDAFFIMFDRAT